MTKREYIARMKRNKRFCEKLLNITDNDTKTLCDMHLFLSDNINNLRDIAEIAKSTLNDLIEYKKPK